MKLSEVTLADVKGYLRIDGTTEDATINAIMAAASDYIKGYTGLTEEIIDTHEVITIAFYVLCNDMYENRLTTLKEANENRTVTQILNMYSTNFI